MPRVPHICFISWHRPIDMRVMHKMAKSMGEAGFRITWVGPESELPEETYGIEWRCYPVRTYSSRPARLLHPRRVKKIAKTVKDVDVYYAPEPDSAAVACRLAKRNGAKVIFDIHEIYHDEMLARWTKGFIRTLCSWYLRRSIRRTCDRCDLVVAVSETVMAPYVETPSQQMIVHNFATESFAAGPMVNVLSDDREEVVIMHGKGVLSRGTKCTLQAVALAKEKLERPLRVLVFTSDGAAGGLLGGQLQEMATELGIPGCMDGVPPVPFEKMPDVLRGCDIGLLMYPRAFGVRALPNRLLEYMSLGIPAVGPSYGLEVKRIVEDAKCGLLVDCEDPQAVANAIVQLCQDPQAAREMGQRGRKAFQERYNWRMEVQPLLDQINQWCL